MNRMTLEAIEKITKAESKNRERKISAEAEAKQMIANAEREGLALLQHVREDAVDQGKELLRQAEARAAERAAEIDQAAKAEADALRAEAGKHLAQAADFIVGRVVKH